MRTTTIQRLAVLSLLYPLLNACEEDPDVFVPPEPGAALIYTYPTDGMVDIPLGTKMILTFSTAIDEAALQQPCEADGDDFAGPICLADSDGNLVPVGDIAQVSNRRRTLSLSMESLREGEQYRLWLAPDIAPGVVNLNHEGPLMRFRTRQYNTLVDADPAVLAINQENPEAYEPGSEMDARFPFMDFSPVRITFTEPLVQTTVRYGDTVKLEHVDSGELVDVAMLSERHYITLDPKEDLIGGDRYRLILSGLEDFDEAPLQEVVYELEPVLSKDNVVDLNPPIKQLMKASPTQGERGYPSLSRLHGLPLNQFNLVTEALGVTQVDSRPLVLEAWMGRPDVHVDAVPVVARAGQQLRISGIDPIKLGGEVRTPLFTGDIIGTFVTDVTGYLLTNPYRPKGFQPDDDHAPMFVYMNFDLAMHAENPNGNASVNQNLMHIQAVGVVDVKDGALTFEVFRTLELDVLSGAATVSADFALGVRADVDFEQDKVNQDPLALTGAFPGNNEVQVEPSSNLILIFNEPVADDGIEDVVLREMASGQQVPAQIRSSGSNLVITPLSELQAGVEYQIDLRDAALTDMDVFAPSLLAFSADDATDGSGQIRFETASYAANPDAPELPPVVLGAYPGIGCALVDRGVEREGVAMAGRCAGGLESDLLFFPFEYDMSRPIEISFNQPMDLASMTLGTIAADGASCDGGAVCLGQEANGSWSNIPMSAQRNSLRMRAYPQPNIMQPEQDYRLVINGEEEVFRNHPRLGGLGINTNPLEGMDGGEGGPAILMDFTSRADFGAVFATVLTREYTDVNGNGVWDDDEYEAVNNHARGYIKDVGGVITDANLDEGDQIFTNAALPMAFLPKQPLDLSYISMVEQGNGEWCAPEPDADGETFCFQSEGDFAIPVEVNAQHVMGSSLTLEATVGGLIPLALDTGALVLRFSPYDDAPVQPLRGFVVNEVGVDDPQFIIRLDAWLDAPDLNPLGLDFLVSHDVKSKRVSAYLKGPVKFLRNGRITLESVNATALEADVQLGINLPLLGDLLDILIPGDGVGSAKLGISKGDFRIRVVNNPTQALLTTAGQVDAGEQ